MDSFNCYLSGLLHVTTIIILIIAFFTLRRRKTRGGLEFFFGCICVAIYSFGYSKELVSKTLEEIDFWSKVQYAGIPFIASCCVFLAYAFTAKNKKKIAFPIKALLIMLPSLTFLFRLTNQYHQLVYVDMKMVNNGYFNVLTFQKGDWYYVMSGFYITCSVLASFMFFKSIKKTSGYMQKQVKVMALTTLYPFISILFNLTGIVPFQLDSGPFIVFLAYMMFAFAIFRFDLMHIIPMSREKIFDWIHDGVIIVDVDMNLKDFNHAMKNVFHKIDKSYIGRNIELFTAECPEFFVLLKNWYENNKNRPGSFINSVPEDIFEFHYPSLELKINYFQARIMGLYDKACLVGITVMITNITKEKEMLKELERRARFDDVTGLFNRRYFIELVDREFTRLMEQSGNGVMVMYDIDHFKRINDHYGHQAGDYVLKELASIAVNLLRYNDLLGRYGGEEYIAFFPDVSIEQAKIIVERIRAAFENHMFVYNGISMKVTASFGLSEYCRQENGIYIPFDEIVKNVDSALYQAKNNGRNQVVVY